MSEEISLRVFFVAVVIDTQTIDSRLLKKGFELKILLELARSCVARASFCPASRTHEKS